MTRPDREDLTRQREALAEAKSQLLAALQAVQYQAQQAARVVTSQAKRPPAVDLTAYLAAHREVLRAEEAYDLAVLDLDTAGGAHA